MAEDSCVCCGNIIPEGHQVCKDCEVGHLKDYNRLYKEKKVRKYFKWSTLGYGFMMLSLFQGMISIIKLLFFANNLILIVFYIIITIIFSFLYGAILISCTSEK